jgi:hypothetical protein
MTMKHRCVLIAAIAFLSAVSFPGSADAQSYQWTGIDTYTIMEIDIATNQVIEQSSGTDYHATLSVDIDSVSDYPFTYASISIDSFGASELLGYDPTSPNFISFSIDETSHAGFAFASVTAGIPGPAIASFFANFEAEPATYYTVETASFQSVPEPSTLTLAGIGGLTLWIFMKGRRALARPGCAAWL